MTSPGGEPMFKRHINAAFKRGKKVGTLKGRDGMKADILALIQRVDGLPQKCEEMLVQQISDLK